MQNGATTLRTVMLWSNSLNVEATVPTSWNIQNVLICRSNFKIKIDKKIKNQIKITSGVHEQIKYKCQILSRFDRR